MEDLGVERSDIFEHGDVLVGGRPVGAQERELELGTEGAPAVLQCHGPSGVSAVPQQVDHLAEDGEAVAGLEQRVDHGATT